MLKSHYTYAYSHICFFPTFTCSAFYCMGSHLRLFLLIEWLMTCMSWTAFISWLGYCSKCWHCCLSKLVTYHCMFLQFGIFLSSFQALLFEQGHRETFYFQHFFIYMIYLSCASSIYLTIFCLDGHMPGADKWDGCPSGILWLLWRSLSSGGMLHNQGNWPSSCHSGVYSHCFFLFLVVSLIFCCDVFSLIRS